MKERGVKVELTVPFTESMSSSSEEKSRVYQLMRSGLEFLQMFLCRLTGCGEMWVFNCTYEEGLAKTHFLNRAQISSVALKAVLCLYHRSFFS